jgi:hypothetical protein
MPPQYSGTERAVDGPAGATVTPAGSVESVSTRVLLDSGSRTCRTCGTVIDAGSRYRCLTLRDSDGSVSEFAFCDEDCAKAFFE